MGLYVVTGGAGFIGSHLCDALIARGDKVRILDNFSTGSWDNVPADADVICGDAANPVVVRHALKGADGVFHLAAVASVQRSNEAWFSTHRTNISATVAVLEAIVQEARTSGADRPMPMVYASSAAVYGTGSDQAISEDNPTRPLTAYGVDKLSCEHHAAVGGSIHGIPTAGFRFFNVYGPRQDPSSPYSGVISIFADRLIRGDGVTVFGDGTQVRDFIHVSDIVRFLLAGMENATVDGPVYNACTGRQTTLVELIDAIHSAGTDTPDVTFAEGRPGDIPFSLGNPEKARSDLNVEARVTLREGIAGLVAEATGKRFVAAA